MWFPCRPSLKLAVGSENVSKRGCKPVKTITRNHIFSHHQLQELGGSESACSMAKWLRLEQSLIWCVKSKRKMRKTGYELQLQDYKRQNLRKLCYQGRLGDKNIPRQRSIKPCHRQKYNTVCALDLP